MKSITLEAHKDMPGFLQATELNNLRDQHKNVYVTEALDTEVVDVLVDKREQSVKLRVDAKGRGPDWKFWKDHFESTTGSDYLLKTCPIDICIIRCSTSRTPCFLKVLGVVSVDTVSKAMRWIPFMMVKKFCESVNMSPMPVTYSGTMSFDHIKGLVDKPMLGVKRDGILVIPDGIPTVYIKIPVNVDADVFMPEVGYDVGVMNALTQEFANRAFDEKDLKKDVTNDDDLGKFVQEKLRKASEGLMLTEYVQRAEQEAGMKAQEAGIMFKETMAKRAKKLWRQYSG